MRIGIFTNNYLPRVSGLANSIEGFRKGFEKLGHDFYIFAPRYGSYIDKNKNIFRLKNSLFLKKENYALPLGHTKKLEKLVESLNLDIIHSQHPWFIGHSARHFARKFKKPLLFTYHTLYDQYLHYVPLIPSFVLKFFVMNFAIAYCNSCQAVIAPTPSVKKTLLKYKVSTPIYIVPSGVDTEKFSSIRKETIREKLRLKESDLLLVTVARLAPEKNLEFLLRVFKKLSGKRSNVYYLIVGGGPSAEGLKKLARDLNLEKKVFFAGPIPAEFVAPYFKAGDLFIYSSLSETQGLIIIEAFAAGLPAVAIKASGSEDQIRDGANGFLTENSEEDFLQKTLRVLDDIGLREKMSKMAISTANEYSIDAVSRKLLRVYEEVKEKWQRK